MLRGERVIVRALCRDDLRRRCEFLNDPDFVVLFSDDPWTPVPFERVEARFEERMETGGDPDDAEFAIEADGKYIGHCVLFDFDHLARTAMLGIGIGDPEYQGRGYGREVIRLVLDYAFRIRNLQKVWLTVNAGNKRAIRAYAACGFVEEGRQRRQIWTQNAYDDLVTMGLLREEWEAPRGQAPA